MAKILRKFYENHNARFPKLNAFIGQKLIIRHYYIQNVEDRIQIRAHKINKEKVAHLSRLFQ